MAKKNKVIDLDTGKITTEVSRDLPAVRMPNTQKMTAAQFASLPGAEVSLGIRLLKLSVDEAAGPFILVKILLNQDCTPAGAKKPYDPVDVYVATDPSGLEIRMPISASFVGKAKDLKLAPGDEFSILRMENYHSKTYNKDDCQSFGLAITKRAGK